MQAKGVMGFNVVKGLSDREWPRERRARRCVGTALCVLLLLAAGAPAGAVLSEFYSATGNLALSVDGAGSNGASHLIEVEKPNATATVRKAFLLAASTGFRVRTLIDDDVAINGTGMRWDAVIPGPIGNSNARADVTAIVKPIVDSAAPGRISFTLTEVDTTGIDGEVLAVVFDDPMQGGTSTVLLLFGSQAPAGDSFAITLAEPINPAARGAKIDMGLGITFGFQGPQQYSIVEVNGSRLTTSAGGQDDGVAQDGALITAGGLDDSNANPSNPFATPTGPRDDDELYSLLPFVTPTSTNIAVTTQNPSNDDDILFAYFHLSTAAILGEGIVLAPPSATNPVGTTHTVTATVADDVGAPVVGRTVTFLVVSGPNAGETGTDDTDAQGKATFTYTGDGGEGIDTIRASFQDSQGGARTSNDATKHWAFPCGNDVREGSEQCDDGNGVDCDGCDTDCTISACGCCALGGAAALSSRAQEPGRGPAAQPRAAANGLCEGPVSQNTCDDLGGTLQIGLVCNPNRGCDQSACAPPMVYSSDADFDQGTLLNVNHDVVHGQLQLNQATSPFPFVNIAISGRGTIARIDVNSGAILGEYQTAPDGMGRDPSRTTVDQLGNVWVSNRAEGGVSAGQPKGSIARVGLVIGGTRTNASGTPDPAGQYLKPPFQYNTCVDRDGNSLIKTSFGLGNVLPWTNSGSADTDGGVSTADDECIINYTRIVGTNARTVAVDANNDVWTGGLGNLDHEKVSGVTGLPIPGTQFNLNCGGYGGLLDASGVLWSARGGAGLLRFVPNAMPPPAGSGVCLDSSRGDYGLGIDPSTGHIWHTNISENRIAELAADGTVLNAYAHGDYYAQGVAVDSSGNVWVAHSLLGPRTVGHLRTDGTFVGNIDVGDGPTGVAVDSNGKIWVANYYSWNAVRIDPNAGPIGGGGFPVGAVDLTVDLGNGAYPYNYSDMTGFVAIGATSPQGSWTVVKDSGVADAAWNNILWNSEPEGSEPAGSSITVEARAANTQTGLGSQTFMPMSNGAPTGLTGQFIEVRVTLRATPAGVSPVLSDLQITGCAPSGGACGDGIVDAGEECDPRQPNPCCNASTCTFEPSSTSCDTDGNACTTDHCDGQGGCVFSANAGQGTPCTDDGRLCTTDQCDGAGACVHPPVPPAQCPSGYVLLGSPPLAAVAARLTRDAHANGAVCGTHVRALYGADMAGDVIGRGAVGAAVVLFPSSHVHGDVATGGGSLVRRRRAIVDGTVDTSGGAPEVDDCTTASQRAHTRRAQLEALGATQTLPAINLSSSASQSITMAAKDNVVDVGSIVLRRGARLQLRGVPGTTTVVMRVHGPVRLGNGSRIELLDGLTPGQVLFVVAGDVSVGSRAQLSGSVFATGRTYVKPNGVVNGQIVGGNTVALRVDAQLNLSPWVGW
jgi:choice-of-anchor A domain-containing protein